MTAPATHSRHPHARHPHARHAGRRPALLLAAALLLASACTSGTDETLPSSSTTASTGGGAASTAAGTPGQPTTPGTGGSRWDIDAALAADPNCANPVQGDPLIIGYAADLGVLGGFADGPASETAKHLAKLVNCSGGFGGRPVRVDVADISGTPTQTRAAVLSLVQGGAQVLLGPPFPDPGLRVLQATLARTAVIFTGSTEPALADATDLSYLVAFNDTQGASAAAQFAQSRGWKKAVTLSSPGPYFGYNVRVFTAAFTGTGGQVLADLPFIPVEQTDFADAVAQIAQNPPDLIYTPMLAEQLVALKDQLEAAGLGDVELVGSDAFEASFGYQLPNIDGIYHVTHADPAPDSRLEKLIASYTAATGSPRPGAPSMVGLTGDAFAVIADAYLRVGSTDPTALGRAIAADAGVQGVTGVLSYNNSGAPTKPIYIHKVVNGQATLAYKVGT